jgi:hypothetical protein
MGDPKELSYELAVACDKLTKEYQATLNDADLDENTYNVLYDLGADFKHAFDAFAEAIRKYVEVK